MKNYATIGGIAAICICILFGEDINYKVKRAWRWIDRQIIDEAVDAVTTSDWEREQNEKAAYELESERLRWIYRECSLKGTPKYYSILKAHNFDFEEERYWVPPHRAGNASATDIKRAYWELRGELGYWAWDKNMRFSVSVATVGIILVGIIGGFSNSAKKAKAEPKPNGPVAKLKGTNYEWKKS